MSIKKTLGGDRLGSGKKMKVELHGYERSTHDMGYLWRSTMSAGTLVPFMVDVALPGDSFDIELECEIQTHPTVGPLFGSFKVQLDVFQAPIRLYNALLHNNKLGIGMNMSQVRLPQITLYVKPQTPLNADDPDNSQINPSCLLSYLNIRGIGQIDDAETTIQERQFNGVPFLAYWEIYKNYYSNKMEGQGAVIHNENLGLILNITSITNNGNLIGTDPVTIIDPYSAALLVTYTGTPTPAYQIMFDTNKGRMSMEYAAVLISDVGGVQTYTWKHALTGDINLFGWTYLQEGELPQTRPNVRMFALDTIDNMRESILAGVFNVTTPFDINAAAQVDSPYALLLQWVNDSSTYLFSQQGLGLKTYQSDLLNNWLDTEMIDGVNGINELTKIDTTDGGFTIDALNISKKVYDMLNRIAVSGGSYDDWLDVVYMTERYTRCESPIYHGGLIKELIFQEVISNSESSVTSKGDGQPLGTLAGRGIMARKHKGGKIVIRVDEPSYIIGIVSLTPRIDYSQGNKWDVNLKTLDDLHKPALDEIGFQELITEQMAWWETKRTLGVNGQWIQQSAGKQPAWLNYMTNINQTRGNFAVTDNEMFMTLNRKYEYDFDGKKIGDLTTYIDPVKFNHIFADTSLDSQNFWCQIAVDMTTRRKMSAKLMPNI